MIIHVILTKFADSALSNKPKLFALAIEPIKLRRKHWWPVPSARKTVYNKVTSNLWLAEKVVQESVSPSEREKTKLAQNLLASHKTAPLKWNCLMIWC